MRKSETTAGDPNSELVNDKARSAARGTARKRPQHKPITTIDPRVVKVTVAVLPYPDNVGEKGYSLAEIESSLAATISASPKAIAFRPNNFDPVGQTISAAVSAFVGTFTPTAITTGASLIIHDLMAKSVRPISSAQTQPLKAIARAGNQLTRGKYLILVTSDPTFNLPGPAHMGVSVALAVTKTQGSDDRRPIFSSIVVPDSQVVVPGSSSFPFSSTAIGARIAEIAATVVGRRLADHHAMQHSASAESLDCLLPQKRL